MGEVVLPSKTLWGFAEPRVNNGGGNELRNCLRYASAAHIFVLYGTKEQLKTAREYLERAKSYIRFTDGNSGIDEIDDYLGAVEADLMAKEQLGSQATKPLL